MIRSHSTDSEASQDQSPKRVCMGEADCIAEESSTTNMASNVDHIQEIKSMLLDLKNSQDSLRKSMDSKLNSVTNTVANKIDSLKEDLYLELGRLESKVQKIEQRLTNLEERHQKEEEFPVDKSIIVINMREEKDEDTEKKCTELIQTGLGLREMKPVRCTRLTSRDGKPGIIKVQLRSKQDKISVLRHKNELNKTPPYKRVYIRSAQTHEERLMRQNLQVLMRDLPNSSEYRFTGNGRLVKKSEASQATQQGLSLHGSPDGSPDGSPHISPHGSRDRQ